MSLIVEDGSGVTGANSFISVSAAGTYLGTRSDTWLSASTVEQENALIEGGIYLNSLSWKGQKLDRDQYMAFPRINFYDGDGYLYDYDAVPRNVTYANAEAATLILDGFTLQPNVTATDRLKRKKIDVLEKEWFSNAYSGKNRFGIFDGLLTGFITAYGTIARS